jgi:enoyl-CoA hydratase/carnithine racemase
MQTVLLQERIGPIAVLTLNRPDSLNSVNADLRGALVRTLREVNADRSVAAVIITGAGERAFCSGQDLSEIAGLDQTRVDAWLTEQHGMYQAVRDLDKPAIAAFNGVAAGAGFQIGLCCDLRIGFAQMKIGQPEIRAGLASIVGSYLMTLHLGIGHNIELSLTGELIDGTRAHAIGLLHHLVPKEEVLSKATSLAEELAKLGPTALSGAFASSRRRALTAR